MTSPQNENTENMDCRRAFEKLFEMLDGRLPKDIEQKLRDHVSTCPHCFTQADFEKRFLSALRSAKEATRCPGGLRAKVTDALRAVGFRG